MTINTNSGTLAFSGAGFTLTVPETGTAVLLTATQTLTNKTLTTPTIGDFSNAQHSHTNAAGGGQLSLTTAVTGVLPPANGGTGVDNGTRTLTINTNSGTLAFSGAAFTLTIPKTGTVPVGTGTAGRIAEWVTDANTVQASTLAKTGAGVLTLAAAANYTLTIPATGTAALLGTAQTFTQTQTVSYASTGVAYQLVLSNTSTDAAARGGLQMVRGGDAGTGSARGASLFTTSTLFGFADYETRTIAIYTGESVGNNAPRLVVLGNGNVGIGTTNPTEAFQVGGGSVAAGNVFSTIRLTNNATGGTNAFMVATDNGWLAGGAKIGFGHGSTLSANIQMVLTSAGNVGIGTTNPTEAFQVGGGSVAAGNVFSTIRLTNNATGGTNAFMVATDNGWLAGGAKIGFGHGSTTSGNIQMVLTSAGNVGIGTTSPTAQLHVNQSSATGAKPTLRLRQAALTEEFIRFDTTVGAGNPINTAALGTYYGRVRVWVEGVGEKWLALYNT